MPKEFELGKANLEIIKTLVQRVISDAVDTKDKPDLDKVVEEIEKFLAKLTRLYRMGLLFFLRLLDMGPLVLGFRHTFTHLPEEDQLKYLNTIERSKNYAIRGIIQALKSVVILVYFSEPEAEKAVGYDCECLVKG